MSDPNTLRVCNACTRPDDEQLLLGLLTAHACERCHTAPAVHAVRWRFVAAVGRCDGIYPRSRAGACMGCGVVSETERAHHAAHSRA